MLARSCGTRQEWLPPSVHWAGFWEPAPTLVKVTAAIVGVLTIASLGKAGWEIARPTGCGTAAGGVVIDAKQLAVSILIRKARQDCSRRQRQPRPQFPASTAISYDYLFHFLVPWA